jgi:hypothetical protein
MSPVVVVVLAMRFDDGLKGHAFSGQLSGGYFMLSVPVQVLVVTSSGVL